MRTGSKRSNSMATGHGHGSAHPCSSCHSRSMRKPRPPDSGRSAMCRVCGEEGSYAVAVRSWERAWDQLATMFDYPPDIRRLIYTTNAVEGYNRQLRKVTKTKGAFPTVESVRKL